MDPSLLNSAVGHGSLNQDCSHMGLDAENGVSGGISYSTERNIVKMHCEYATIMLNSKTPFSTHTISKDWQRNSLYLPLSADSQGKY